MNHMPRVILAGLLDRFSETAKGSSKYIKQLLWPTDKLIMSLYYRPVITPAMDNKLLAWQFALRLSLENWSADIAATAEDLQMTPQK